MQLPSSYLWLARALAHQRLPLVTRAKRDRNASMSQYYCQYSKPATSTTCCKLCIKCTCKLSPLPRMGCCQSSVANPALPSQNATPRVAWMESESADSLSTPATGWKVPSKLAKLARWRRRSRSVHPEFTVVQEADSRFHPTLLELWQRAQPPTPTTPETLSLESLPPVLEGATLPRVVQEASRYSPTLLELWRRAQPPTPTTPETLSLVSLTSTLEGATLPQVQQQPGSDSDASSPPPTSQVPASISDILFPPSQPHNNVVRRSYPVPAQVESPSSLTAFRHRHTQQMTTSYAGSPRLTMMVQQHRPLAVLTRHNVGPVRPPPISARREQRRNGKEFRERVQLHHPVSSRASSDENSSGRRHQAHQRMPPKRNKLAQAHLKSKIPLRRGSSLPPIRKSKIPLRRGSSLPPIRMEIPWAPNIVPYERTRGGIAYEYLFELRGSQTSPNCKPLTRSARRRRYKRIQAELEPRLRLFEEKRRVSMQWYLICVHPV